ncbi:hypothetical protein D3C72_1857990 [compost metagenome]
MHGATHFGCVGRKVEGEGDFRNVVGVGLVILAVYGNGRFGAHGIAVLYERGVYCSGWLRGTPLGLRASRKLLASGDVKGQYDVRGRAEESQNVQIVFVQQCRPLGWHIGRARGADLDGMRRAYRVGQGDVLSAMARGCRGPDLSVRSRGSVADQ